MSRYHSYLNSAIAVISLYKGEEPFSTFIKKYFSKHKKYGAKDRKQVTHLCYCYFRLGKALPAVSAAEKILTALFLCSEIKNDLLEALQPEWNEKVGLSWSEKNALLNHSIDDGDIFPLHDHLSDTIDKNAFIQSHLLQPDLFIRIRPGNEKTVLKKLQDADLHHTIISEQCIALTNGAPIESVVDINKEVVIQDYSSQRVAAFFPKIEAVDSLSAWDCCAASGGKSILIKDRFKHVNLSVSDVRETILINLKKRFAAAGIKKYKSFVADLTRPLNGVAKESFDFIIADVPCSGSGTWGRTPEQLQFFKERSIEDYSSLQQKIIENVVPFIKPGGYLQYITCSVFKKENEEAVELIQKKFHLQLIKMETLKGYDKKADTMFAALLKKLG